MHEYSIINALFELSQNHAKAHNAKRIAKIIITLGELSNVDRALIKSAFMSFREHFMLCESAELEIETQNIMLECPKCGHKFSPVGLDNANCPICASSHTHIIKGKELHLARLELDIEE